MCTLTPDASADGLRAALSAAVDGAADRVLAEVNALLAAHPPRPRLSGHSTNWHVHLAFRARQCS